MKCNFCGKTHEQAYITITAEDGTTICSECILKYAQVIQNSENRKEPTK